MSPVESTLVVNNDHAVSVNTTVLAVNSNTIDPLLQTSTQQIAVSQASSEQLQKLTIQQQLWIDDRALDTMSKYQQPLILRKRMHNETATNDDIIAPSDDPKTPPFQNDEMN